MSRTDQRCGYPRQIGDEWRPCRGTPLNGDPWCPRCMLAAQDAILTDENLDDMLGPFSCECGWRAESPATHPHVAGCPDA